MVRYRNEWGIYEYPLYFIDNNSVIHTVVGDRNCTLTNCFDIEVVSWGLNFRHLHKDGEEFEVFGEYRLWNTLTELAKQIEGE